MTNMHNTTNQMPSPPEYVLVVGNGRSGTKWLLSILDSSPSTHCRNEPDEITTSPLAKLPSPQDDLSLLDKNWDAAISWAATHIGERDLAWTGRKDYVFELSRITGLTRALDKRPRSFLSMLLPALRGAEWELPFWIGDRNAMSRALPVLKFVQAPLWTIWALRHRPSAQVLHIVRHPGGFLNSWKRRYLNDHAVESVTLANRKRLQAIARTQPEWGDRFGDISELSVMESELWYWRYATETIHNVGYGQPRYALIVYEQLASKIIEQAQRVFQTCGLSWDARIERRIKQQSGDSDSIATAWKLKLSSEDIAAVERVLAGSIMENWWL